MDGTLTTTVITGGLMTAFEVATKDVKHDPLELTERVLILNEPRVFHTQFLTQDPSFSLLMI